MPFSNDQEPLVPPTLKRIEHELKCHGSVANTPTRPLAPHECEQYSYTSFKGVIDNSRAQNRNVKPGDRLESCNNGSFVTKEGVSNGDWSTILPDTLSLDRTEKPLPGRPPRSTIQGFVAQFNQFHVRRPNFQRLTLALGSLFGRMCSRRRAMPKDDGDNSDTESSISSIDGDHLLTDNRQSLRVGAQRYECVMSDAATVGDSDEDLLKDFGMNPGWYSDSDNESDTSQDVDLGDGNAGSEEAREFTDRCVLNVSREKRVISSAPPQHQRRSRWTLLSPLNLLKVVKLRKSQRTSPDQQLMTPNNLRQTGWGPLEFRDITNSATTDEDNCYSQFCSNAKAKTKLFESECPRPMMTQGTHIISDIKSTETHDEIVDAQTKLPHMKSRSVSPDSDSSLVIKDTESPPPTPRLGSDKEISNINQQHNEGIVHQENALTPINRNRCWSNPGFIDDTDSEVSECLLVTSRDRHVSNEDFGDRHQTRSDVDQSESKPLNRKSI